MMTREVVTVGPATSAEYAPERMAERGFAALPVVDEDDAASLLLGPDPATGTYTVAAQSGDGLPDLTNEHLHATESPLLPATEETGEVVTLDRSTVAYENPRWRRLSAKASATRPGTGPVRQPVGGW